MKIRSLRFRLLLSSFLAIFVAIIATSFALNDQFHRYFEDRIYQELHQHLEQLTANVSIDETGQIAVDRLANNRFSQPFSGLYWQVSISGQEPILSRSLWNTAYEIPTGESPGHTFKTVSVSPVDEGILVLGWKVQIGEGAQKQNIILSIAANQSEVNDATAGLRVFLIRWLLAMFGVLTIASWLQVKIGLSPLAIIRNKVERIRSKQSERLEGVFPSEVEPLVEEINGLLSLHEQTLEIARDRASDLAHGLKTPLTVMRSISDDLSAGGHTAQASQIEAQVAMMHHYVERELARVKVTVQPDKLQPAKATIERLVESFSKLPRGSELAWRMDIAEDLATPLDPHDLTELLGNIIDNARKWTKSEIVIGGEMQGKHGWISVQDNGAGVAKHLLGAVLTRGSRLDAKVAGTGLGLTISSDLAEQMGGSLTLKNSPSGGLDVTVSW